VWRRVIKEIGDGEADGGRDCLYRAARKAVHQPFALSVGDAE
jgi:hypothetical protein